MAENLSPRDRAIQFASSVLVWAGLALLEFGGPHRDVIAGSAFLIAFGGTIGAGIAGYYNYARARSLFGLIGWLAAVVGFVLMVKNFVRH